MEREGCAGRTAMGTDIGREFEAYQRSSYTEKLREQLARAVEAATVPLTPVVICVSRGDGNTEMTPETLEQQGHGQHHPV